MNISTRQLRAFVSAASHFNFTRAASEVALSQPAFSALIKSLERELGAQLFVRNTRNVELTPFGQLFDAFARRTLFEMEAALRNLQDYAQGRVGKVHIALLPSIAASWLPPVLKQFRTQFPAVVTAVTDGMSQQCVEMLVRGDIDFALATTDHYASDLQRKLLWTDQFHLVCTVGHPLAKQRKVALDQIAQHPFIHFVKHSSVRQHVDAAFGKRALQAVLEVEHLPTMSGMVESEVGISVVPTLTLCHFQSPKFAIRSIADTRLSRDIYLLWRRNKEFSLPARALRDLLVAHVESLRAPTNRPRSF